MRKIIFALLALMLVGSALAAYGPSNFVGSTSTTTTTTTTSTSGGGGGGGGGLSAGNATPTSSETKSWSQVEAGVTATMKISEDSIAFTSISFIPHELVSGVKVKVTAGVEVPLNISNPYKYLEVTLLNVDESKIGNQLIEFSVPKKWLTDNNRDPKKVVLHRYQGSKWNALPTTMAGSDAAVYNYEASTPGFSYFAITAEKMASAAPVEEPSAPAPAAEEPVRESVELTEAASEDSEVAFTGTAAGEEKSRNLVWVGLAVLIVLGGGVFMLQKKKKR